MEEERRLCYVGMTRAKEELHLLAARSRLLYGARQYNAPSQFLSDVDGKAALASVTPQFMENEPQVIPEEIDIEIGDRVKHRLFGVGKIIALEGTTVSVDFASRGLKKLDISFAPLEKL
jgi:DNA helicase-2/ATP-dependent DNA helicase PcrA